MAANAVRQSPLQFDLFELDPSGCELRRRGVPVDLPPQALRVLVLLAGSPNELVTRKQIKEALWPGQAYGDFDSRLNFTVKKLRDALGDVAEQPRYVQTVRNAGYRFIAPVQELPKHSAGSASSVGQSGPNDEVLCESISGTPAGGGFLRGRSGLFFVLVTAVLVAGMAGVFLALRRSDPSRVVSSEAKAPPATQAEYEPRIDSVTAIVARARQRIVIRGRGFGLHVPYVHTDSPYLAVRDLTAHWAAGRMIPQNSDEVMVDVESWTDTEIVVSGFSGDYGAKGWELAPGDDVEVAVWNPQSGLGPGLCRVGVVSVSKAH